MTKPDLKLIRERCESATSGKWKCIQGDYVSFISTQFFTVICENPDADGDFDLIAGSKIDLENAQFIAASKQDIPLLLDYIEKLEKQLSFVKCCARSGESFTNEDLEKL